MKGYKIEYKDSTEPCTHYPRSITLEVFVDGEVLTVGDFSYITGLGDYQEIDEKEVSVSRLED